MGAQERHVAHLHRRGASYGSENAGHQGWLARAPGHGGGVVQVGSVQDIGKAVEIALSAHLAVGDDIDPDALLIMQGNE